MVHPINYFEAIILEMNVRECINSMTDAAQVIGEEHMAYESCRQSLNGRRIRYNAEVNFDVT